MKDNNVVRRPTKKVRKWLVDNYPLSKEAAKAFIAKDAELAASLAHILPPTARVWLLSDPEAGWTALVQHPELYTKRQIERFIDDHGVERSRLTGLLCRIIGLHPYDGHVLSTSNPAMLVEVCLAWATESRIFNTAYDLIPCLPYKLHRPVGQRLAFCSDSSAKMMYVVGRLNPEGYAAFVKSLWDCIRNRCITKNDRTVIRTLYRALRHQMRGLMLPTTLLYDIRDTRPDIFIKLYDEYYIKASEADIDKAKRTVVVNSMETLSEHE